MIADDLSRIAMSSGLAASLSRATDHARARGHVEVTLEHILLALCDDPDAVLVLAASNVNVAELIDEVDGQLGLIPPHPDGQHAELLVSEDLKRILEAAAAAARGGRRREINGAIVLAAIVGDGKSLAAQVLGAQGMTFEGAIRALQARVSTPPPSQPAAAAPDAESILAGARERVQSRTVAPLPMARAAVEASAQDPDVAQDRHEHARDHSAFSDPERVDASPSEAVFPHVGQGDVAASDAAPLQPETDGRYDREDAPRDEQFDDRDGQSDFDEGFDEPAQHQPSSTQPPRPPAHRVTRPELPNAQQGAARSGMAPPPPPPDFSAYSGESQPARREQQGPVWASWPASEPEFGPDLPDHRPPPRRPEAMEPAAPPRHQQRPPMSPSPAPSFPEDGALSDGDYPEMQAHRGPPPSGDDYPSYETDAADEAGPETGRYGDFGAPEHDGSEPDAGNDEFVGVHEYDEPPMPASAPFPPPVRPPVPSHTSAASTASAHDGWAPPPPPLNANRVPSASRPPAPPVPSAAAPVHPDVGPDSGPSAFLRRSQGPSAPSQERPGPPPLAPWPEPETHVSAAPAPASMPPAPTPPGRGEVVPFDRRPGHGPVGSAGPAAGAPLARAPRTELGQLVENIPRVMRVSIPALIEVRIARADVQRLADGLQGGGAAYQHDVTITKAMSVRLRAPDGGFFIETASPETQWIDKAMTMSADDFASWRWHVTPRETGRKRLQLIISARTVGADGLAAETALPDQVISVRVRTNYAQTATRWAGWGAAAIVGGLLAKFGEGVVSMLGGLTG